MLADAADFQGQSLAKRLVGSYLQKGRLAGTLLLLGERGLGKTTFATIVARALVCERNPDKRLWFCGGCYACSSIASGNQPEYVTVRPRGQDITVSQVREEYDDFNSALLHPNLLSHRIFIFDDAHHLNEETGNGLLKLFEEAPERTVFILVSDKPQMLLPTIRSRGTQVRLTALPEAELYAALSSWIPQAKGEGLSEAVRMSAGRIVDALHLLGSERWRGAVKQLGAALAGGRGDFPRLAKTLADFEQAALWAKELADSGLSEAEAAKLIPAARKNTLGRLALVTAYDRAAWWALMSDGGDSRGISAGVQEPLALLKSRILQNCDAELAQAAFSLSLPGSR
jgi:DNA polymerase III delta prime subunit